ncbi:serine/threonine-protein phosphatase 1 regulatory subunit 10-like isoform X2 [Ischnura elegans]|uniref:serine/threonine-protein phosphatase 1 regulatory subunit 10-like isoform X1 n=1 Tax=Ischnura elegans TaxID=197161 RepID=UPI001ED882EA|nr:serine/threonine-protein phosphatase 1 regulatory subunit 10-like isoform X1 [Ischnura elegans]XP_046398554.1 serine/threonine-protein phosphatase 1 regulatory subunit 10-like isoform X2 [Ischnura elegans]
MPRIDPLQLLKCLSVLLSPDGGIKSRDEVSRLVSLMTKFSKKLVSKCIYIQILRATKSDLLDMFMAAGGWNLTHQWLLDAIMAKNHPLNCEILQLLSLCPVNVERLRSNSCPKLVKGLSLESFDENEKLLASNLVIQWMEVVRNEVEVGKDTVSGTDAAIVEPTNSVLVAEKSDAVNSISVDVVVETSPDSRTNETPSNSVVESDSVGSVEKQIAHAEEVQNIPVVDGEERTEEGGGTSEDSNSPWDAPLPLYKIMIRDGKQVLAKVYSEKRPATDIPSNEIPAIDENVSGAVIVNVPPAEERLVNDVQESETSVLVTPSPVTSNSNEKVEKLEEPTASEVLESKELESEKKTKSNSCDTSSVKGTEVSVKATKESKKKLKETKVVVDSTREKRSRNLDSESPKEKNKEKDRDRGKLKEKVKEEKKKDVKINQAEKDRETLAKIMIVSSAVSKSVGKIPKKKSSTDDSNSEIKKATPTAHEVRRAQKPSVSIEVRRSQGSLGEPRPKTVKTFNSKFRSTGLEEEVKPPPPRNAAKKSTTEKNARLPIPSKRPSPPREIFPPEKKPRAGSGILTDVAHPAVPAYVADDLPRKGDKANVKTNAIKTKDKPHAFLQESDVFMDALTAVSRKEPRRRKRRISSSKDDEKPKGKDADIKKEEAGDGLGGTPPHSPDEKSPPVLKPSFKFYQDTLETEDETKKVKEENLSDEERRATTPTPGDDSPSAENENSDEDSQTKGLKNKAENDNSVTRKRIKKEEDDNDSSESDDVRRREVLSRGLRGILVYHKRVSLKTKRSVKWKEDGELEKVVYFELDETERVNVTKTFMDMKQMERTHEREAFQMARKLAHEDTMEERMQWKALIPLMLPPPLAEPGSKSREKDVQYAREKVVLQSLYFHREMIPDSASEPDNENHPTTDPKIIPLNDASGNPDSINDFQSTPWPEPKSIQPPMPVGPPMMGSSGPSGGGPLMGGMPDVNDPNFMAQHSHPHMVQGHPMIGGGMPVPFAGGMHPNQMGGHGMHGYNAAMGGAAMAGAQMGTMDNNMHQRAPHVMMTGPRPMMHQQNAQPIQMTGMMNPGIQGVTSSGGDWRTADGKVVPVEDSQPMVMYPQGGVAEVGMGGNNGPQVEGEVNAGYEMEYGAQYQEGMEEASGGVGPGYMMPPMNYAGGANNNVRPPHGGAMYGHPPMFRGGSGSRGGRGGPAPRGGPWFRPNGPPRGRGGGGGNWEMRGGRGGGRGNLRVTPCKHFRAGYCRNGEQCSFLHPGVNGPPVPYMYSE